MNPIQNIFLFHAAIRHTKAKRNNVFIGRFNVYPIQFQKTQHHINTNSFIPIHKSVIRDQRVSKLRSFFFLRRIQLNPIKSCKSTLYR